ncbi:MAG: MATE family efflux transporter, partial [Oscillospiraceae bacterium]|nr:MATE family efflux transporter [Oscillospiraceae bacterium]
MDILNLMERGKGLCQRLFRQAQGFCERLFKQVKGFFVGVDAPIDPRDDHGIVPYNGLFKRIKGSFEGLFKQGKGFYKTLFKVALPIIGANFMQNALGLADTFMVGQLGDNAVAAAALANRFVFIYSLITFGVLSGGSVLAAQYWGKKDVAAIEGVLAIALRLTLSLGVVFSLVALTVPDYVMRIFTNVPEVITLGAGYIRIISMNFLITGFTNVYANFIRNVEQPKLSFWVSFSVFFANFGLNYVFIFGKLGFPAMGLNGAALGSALLAAAVLIVTLCYIKWS